MDLKKFTELANKHLTVLESYKMDKNGNTKIQIFGIEELYKAINYTPCCTEFICHSCNEKKSGQNDDQLHEVCKECFGGI